MAPLVLLARPVLKEKSALLAREIVGPQVAERFAQETGEGGHAAPSRDGERGVAFANHAA